MPSIDLQSVPLYSFSLTYVTRERGLKVSSRSSLSPRTSRCARRRAYAPNNPSTCMMSIVNLQQLLAFKFQEKTTCSCCRNAQRTARRQHTRPEPNHQQETKLASSIACPLLRPTHKPGRGQGGVRSKERATVILLLVVVPLQIDRSDSDRPTTSTIIMQAVKLMVASSIMHRTRERAGRRRTVMMLHACMHRDEHCGTGRSIRRHVPLSLSQNNFFFSILKKSNIFSLSLYIYIYISIFMVYN